MSGKSGSSAWRMSAAMVSVSFSSAPRQSKRNAAGSQMYSPPSGAMPCSTAWVEDAVIFSSLVLW